VRSVPAGALAGGGGAGLPTVGVPVLLISPGRGRVCVGAAGRCVIGLGAPGRAASPGVAGKGCLGPDSTCPGFGAGVDGPGNGFAAGGTGRPGVKTAAGGVCPGVPSGG